MTETTRDHIPVPQIENLIRALMQVAEHDWRVSHLAHVSDTAGEAASWLRVLLSYIAKGNEASNALRTRAETAEASCLVMMGLLTKYANTFETGWPGSMPQPGFEVARLVEREARQVLKTLPASAAALLARVKELEGFAHAFRNADDKDWTHLITNLPDSGHGKFWRVVLTEAFGSIVNARRAHSVARSKT